MITLLRKSLLIVTLPVLLITAACGGGTPATPINTPTPIPTFVFVQPTLDPVLATAAAQRAERAADTVAVERGQDRYVALECASCHGENGEGVDDAPALIGMTLSEEDFITFMRSGGTLGRDHQYSTDRLSASGGRNLYAYLVSLDSAE